MPGETVIAAPLKISDGGARISHVVLLLVLNRFLVRKDLLYESSDVQRKTTQLGHDTCI